MNNISWWIFELIINLFQGALFSYFVFSSLEPKHFIKRKLIPYMACTLAVFSVLSFLNYIVPFEGIAIFVYSCVLYIFAEFFLEGSHLNKIYLSIVPLNAASVGSIFSTNFIAFVVKKPYYEFITSDAWLRLITIFISNFILFSILCAIKVFTSKHPIKLKNTEWLLLTTGLILSMIAYMLIYYSILSSNSIRSNFFCAFCAIVIIIINVTMYILLSNFSNRYQIQLENTLLKQQTEYQAEAIIETKNQYEKLQKIRHDFNNIIGVIQVLNSQHKDEEIENYIQEHFNKQKSSITIISTGNAFIDAIINSKLSEAKANEIEVFISTVSDLDSCNNVDLCSLIGNLFDNAIRASVKSKKKNIKLDIRKEHESIVICMKNSIDSSVLNNNPDLISDKFDKNAHGYGTKIIRDIAAKYSGFADFYEENDFFCCNVIIYP